MDTEELISVSVNSSSSSLPVVPGVVSPEFNDPAPSSMDSETSDEAALNSGELMPSTSSSVPEQRIMNYSLTDIPPHILAKVMQKLPNKSRVYMRRTNKSANNFIEVNRNVIAGPPLGEPLWLELTIYEIPRPPERDCVRYRIRKNYSNTAERINISSPQQISGLSIDKISVTTTTGGDLTVQMGYAKKFLSHIKQTVREIVFIQMIPGVILEMMSYLKCSSLVLSGSMIYGWSRRLLAEPVIQRCPAVSIPLLNQEFPEEQCQILEAFKPFQDVTLNWCSMEFAHAVIWQMARAADLGNLKRVLLPCAWFFSKEIWTVPPSKSIWTTSASPLDVYREIYLVETDSRFILFCEGKIDNISGTIYTVSIFPIPKTIEALLKIMSNLVLPNTTVDLTNYWEDLEKADNMDTINDLFYDAYLEWIPHLEKVNGR